MGSLMNMLGSKAGIAIVGTLMVLGTFGKYKLQIYRLELKLAEAQTEAADIAQRHRSCQSDLGDLRVTFFRQNEQIDRLKVEAEGLALAADQAALQAVTPPAEIEQIIQGPPGHEEMNLFLADLIEEKRP